MSYWTFVLVGALVTWRVTRFIIADDLIKGTRSRVRLMLDRPFNNRRKDFLADKAWTLMTCAWCVSIYVSAGYLLLSRWLIVNSIPMPVWTWLAVAALSILPYQFADGDWVISISRKDPDQGH